MPCLHRNNSYTLCQPVHLPAANSWSINHKNEKATQSVSSSFEISETDVRNLFLFHKLFTICIIYNSQLHIWDSNITCKYQGI